MKENYTYPLDLSWRTDEISSVLSFLNAVEQVYETGCPAEQVIKAYRDFKIVVPSKGEERRIDREFEEVSGYSTYKAIQAAKLKSKGVIRLAN